MFLAATRRRNPALIERPRPCTPRAAFPPARYVVDLDTVAANARLVADAARARGPGLLADDEAVRPQPAGRGDRCRERHRRRRRRRDGRGAHAARARAAHRARRPPRAGAAPRAGRGDLVRPRPRDGVRCRAGGRRRRRRARRGRRPAAAAPRRAAGRPLLRGAAGRCPTGRRARGGPCDRPDRRCGAGRRHDVPSRRLGRGGRAMSPHRPTWRRSSRPATRCARPALRYRS